MIHPISRPLLAAIFLFPAATIPAQQGDQNAAPHPVHHVIRFTIAEAFADRTLVMVRDGEPQEFTAVESGEWTPVFGGERPSRWILLPPGEGIAGATSMADLPSGWESIAHPPEFLGTSADPEGAELVKTEARIGVGQDGPEFLTHLSRHMGPPTPQAQPNQGAPVGFSWAILLGAFGCVALTLWLVPRRR